MFLVRGLFTISISCCVLTGCMNPERDRPMPSNYAEQEAVDRASEPELESSQTLYEDGSVATYAEGYVDESGDFIRHGKMIHYWENGQKKLEMNYVHGLPHGEKHSWYEDGQMWSSGQYVSGKQDGTWIVWYRNGRKAQEDHYADGAWHGLFTKWHPNGQKMSEVEFVRGQKQGTYTQWDEYGNVIKQEEYVDNQVQP